MAHRVNIDSIGTFHIQVGPPQVNGQSISQLEALRRQLDSEGASQEEMAQALDEVISHGDGYTTVERLRAKGKYLFGVANYEPQGTERRVDALLFAQGEGVEPSGAFSMIRVATWSRQNRARTWTDQELTATLIRECLVEVNGRATGYGIPVARTTRITPIHPAEGESEEGYLYGHHKDLEGIRSLPLPLGLLSILTEVTTTWHNAESEGDSPALEAGIQDYLRAWELPAVASDTTNPDSTPA